MGNLDVRRWFAVGAVAVAVLLVLTGVALPYVGRRRGGPEERPGSDAGHRFTEPVRRALVTTSAGPDVPATGGGSGLGRSDAAR
jgi:hypothetical protein